MASLVLTAAWYMIASLSCACSSTGILWYNSYATQLGYNKYTSISYTGIPPWLASTLEWLGYWAWEIETTVTLLHLESTLEFAESLG